MKIKNKFDILTYNVGFIKKPLDEVMLKGIQKNDIVWLKHKYKDRFFADPFLIKQDDNYYYVLCEEYLFWEEKGKITLLKVDRKRFELVSKKVVIEEDYHLSFPACVCGGNIVKPEASKSGKYYEYLIDTDDMRVIHKKEILAEPTVDAIEYSKDDTIWLLTGKKRIPSTELYIYKKDYNGEYTPISDYPVLSDNSCARGAGLFFTWNGKIYRPVQDCRGRYGRQTQIMEIEQLNDKGYKATPYRVINSFDNPPFNETMHTFNVYDDCIIVDGSKDFFRFPMKIFYKKMRWLFRNFKK